MKKADGMPGGASAGGGFLGQRLRLEANEGAAVRASAACLARARRRSSWRLSSTRPPADDPAASGRLKRMLVEAHEMGGGLPGGRREAAAVAAATMGRVSVAG